MKVRVLDNPDSLADLAASTVARLLREAGGRSTLGLAGGGTPRTTYTRLVQEDVEWSGVHAWLGDERWVPPDHPDNNLRMARETLLDHVPAHVYPVPWSDEVTPEGAATRYEQTLLEVLSTQSGEPRPDVVILGLGDDGHTASLFPDTDALSVNDRWFVANWVPVADSWRLTATFPLLRAARHVVFLVAGSSKAPALARILEGPSEGSPPARKVLEGEADVTWLLDRAAAAQLDDTPLEFF